MPYLLRRLKSDKSVITDLPEKVEMMVYASLSKKQVVLYENLIHEIQKTLLQSEGIQRKGLILASLTKFKQLCNHPDQYLGTGEYEEKDSGKFTRLREICEYIYKIIIIFFYIKTDLYFIVFYNISQLTFLLLLNQLSCSDS